MGPLPTHVLSGTRISYYLGTPSRNEGRRNKEYYMLNVCLNSKNNRNLKSKDWELGMWLS